MLYFMDMQFTDFDYYAIAQHIVDGYNGGRDYFCYENIDSDTSIYIDGYISVSSEYEECTNSSWVTSHSCCIEKISITDEDSNEIPFSFDEQKLNAELRQILWY